jgi:chemotaxis protein methyltransferase CheR
MLPPDGVLYLGGAESVLGISDAFKPVKGLRGVYALSSATQTQPATTPQPARQTG